ncbi:MAG: tripartite tricarboxylate transporter substrate binding protein [Pigmentiphaga sp.]|uniref:tripartite tricarboxylate transporter substrate binding protein n=1 Tax=Pigmentiphaga sp. TaxID=1977564 RepID=UPI0029AA9329|nr:tripartite tricarboxylate transporter substrate binding protein [Pigmentiphaga sp.]MDX3907079.1 tripartite tricarboxylate transporter substrate binding protein [Pigmentiphaga sp.]
MLFEFAVRRPRWRVVPALAAGLLLAASAAAAGYPAKPITLVVPFPAGGSVDAVARMLGAQLGKRLQAQVVVENVPGAGGVISTQRVARAAPDGHTLLFATPNHTINPAIVKNLSFDTEKDFAPIGLVAQVPELLVASGGQPFDDFPGFVDYARRHPGKLTYGSAGNGTLPHVTMELLLLKLGLDVVHVPYKGAAPALNDLLGGQIALKMDTITTSQPHFAGGRIKPLAVASLKRSPLLPNVPTIAESGLPGYEGILWLGVLAPAGTPAAVIDTLHRAVEETGRDPAWVRQLEAAGVEPRTTSPQAFGTMIAAEIAQWKDVVRRARITAN